MSARRDEYLVLRRELQRSSAIRRVNDARRHAIYLQDAADYALVQQQCAMVNSCVQDLATTQVSPASPEQVRMRVPRRTRRATHRPENANSVDPPPNYSPYDPHPFFDRAETESMPKHRRRSTIEMIETVCKDGLKVTTEKVGKSLAKGVGGAGKMAKDMPTMVKEVQVKLKVKRAKGKIRWLEKHKYLSRQERFLTQEITG
ncbi:hypothetical protein EJ02DRAFT_420489 [Clathrospora elynae]|uniref:Uncharacterized protein n=1 Tax=Clathrospora elynae TaxID=706981 RepID=A0A6A5SVA8_9PLEO|nr:hypothetical protein EJ02DRAFT_420489 [Clathrospora elynae]